MTRPPRLFFSARLYSTVSSAFKKVGFIGLGNMGSHMANNLLKAGYQLVVHDVDDAKVSMYSERGAVPAETPYEVAKLTDVVITMLPSALSVSEVYLGCNGLLAKPDNIRPSLLIDASTVDPKTCHRISSRALECSLLDRSCRIGGVNHPIFLDAPVSGGILGAEAGILTFMVGGMEDGFNAAKTLFECMGKNIQYCGGCGNGAAAKICNNLALAVSMAGISEALALGQKLGIDAHTLSKIFNTSSARCWSSDTYNPVPGVMKGVPASRDYNGGFLCQLMKKDLELAVTVAKEKGAFTPLAKDVHEMYSKLCEDGKHTKDFSSIFRFIYKGADETSD